MTALSRLARVMKYMNLFLQFSNFLFRDTVTRIYGGTPVHTFSHRVISNQGGSAEAARGCGKLSHISGPISILDGLKIPFGLVQIRGGCNIKSI
jgi:hypothetical protein